MTLFTATSNLDLSNKAVLSMNMSAIANFKHNWLPLVNHHHVMSMQKKITYSDLFMIWCDILPFASEKDEFVWVANE